MSALAKKKKTAVMIKLCEEDLQKVEAIQEGLRCRSRAETVVSLIQAAKIIKRAQAAQVIFHTGDEHE
jgi:hypothetical protein